MSTALLPTVVYRHLDVENGKLEPIAKIYRDTTGKRLNPPTQWRWIKKGNRGIRLEAVPVNGCWCTTRHAFAQWLIEQANARLADPTPENTERDERTTRKLRAAGLIK